jgi:ACT domain-containing protein
VVIIDESGAPGAAESYGAVLSSIGYNVLSVSRRQNSSHGDRKTVIAYAPGKEAQARALARRIPGEKVMAMGGEGLQADTVVIIR